jgi:hypothetical protein
VVDDMLLAYTRENLSTLLEAGAYHLLHLREVHTDDTSQAVGRNNIRIVAISLKIDNLRYVNPKKFIPRVKV